VPDAVIAYGSVVQAKPFQFGEPPDVNQARPGDHGPVETEDEQARQPLQMGKAAVRNARHTQVETLERPHTPQARQPTVGDSGPAQIQILDARQAADFSQSHVGCRWGRFDAQDAR
jgi:hypothetical protein